MKERSGVWRLDDLLSFATDLLHIRDQVTLVPEASSSSSVLQGQDLVIPKGHPG